MKLTVLGSGTLKSPADRNPPGYLLQAGDSLILLDVGPGIIHQLRTLSSDILAVNLILITHFHPDHCSDLIALLLARFLARHDSNHALHLVGPLGFREWFHGQAQWQGKWLHGAMPQVTEWQGRELYVDGWRVLAERTLHTENSLAYRIEREGKRVFFSGDTDYQQSLIPLAMESDLALVECSLPEHLKQVGHLTPKETGIFARQAKVKHLLVTHIYPENDTPDLKKRVADFFDGRITIAEDLMEIEL